MPPAPLPDPPEDAVGVGDVVEVGDAGVVGGDAGVVGGGDAGVSAGGGVPAAVDVSGIGSASPTKERAQAINSPVGSARRIKIAYDFGKSTGTVPNISTSNRVLAA